MWGEMLRITATARSCRTILVYDTAECEIVYTLYYGKLYTDGSEACIDDRSRFNNDHPSTLFGCGNIKIQSSCRCTSSHSRVKGAHEASKVAAATATTAAWWLAFPKSVALDQMCISYWAFSSASEFLNSALHKLPDTCFHNIICSFFRQVSRLH